MNKAPVHSPDFDLRDLEQDPVDQSVEMLLTFLKHDVPENYKPALDRILLYPLVPPPTSAEKSGLYLVSSTSPDHGVIVAVGDGGYHPSGSRQSMENLAVGQVVIFAKHSGARIEKNGRVFLLIRMADILAVREGHNASSST